MLDSYPPQPTSSIRIDPVPRPKYALPIAYTYVVGSPSCLHTTLASVSEKSSSHTVPQVLRVEFHTSSLPVVVYP